APAGRACRASHAASPHRVDSNRENDSRALNDDVLDLRSAQQTRPQCVQQWEHRRGSGVCLTGRRLPPPTVKPIAKLAPKEADMFRKIMAAAAVSALALTSAMAQTSTSPPSSSSPPAAATPVTPAPSASASPAGKANFVTKQTSDQWLASKFKGADVIGTDDKKIG